MDRIRIAIVDDHPIFRDGVAALVRGQEGFVLVGEGSSAEDALRIVRSEKPDVILLDISMPGDGLGALRQIVSTDKRPKVVMLTASESGEDVVAAFSAGATGYLLKGISKSELFDNLKRAHGGAMVLDPELAVRVILLTRNAPTVDKPDDLSQHGLTPRELEILGWLEGGLSNKEIARKLDVNPRTIKNYMTRIMAKLHVRNRVEAVTLIRAMAPSERTSSQTTAQPRGSTGAR